MSIKGISFKFGERRDEWKCFFCCHVRTATIFLGIWYLLLQMMRLSLLSEFVHVPDPPFLPTPLSSELNFSMNSSHNTYERSINRYSERLQFDFIVSTATFTITLLMVYGAVKGKPSFLMPFFCFQLLDFCMTCMSGFCYLGYYHFLLPDAHRMIATSPNIPMKDKLLHLSPESLSLLVLMAFISATLIKAYFIGVVWSCYKYLTLRLVSAQRTLPLIETESTQNALPDYDSAVTKFPPLPPSYSQAINHPTA